MCKCNVWEVTLDTYEGLPHLTMKVAADTWMQARTAAVERCEKDCHVVKCVPVRRAGE